MRSTWAKISDVLGHYNTCHHLSKRPGSSSISLCLLWQNTPRKGAGARIYSGSQLQLTMARREAWSQWSQHILKSEAKVTHEYLLLRSLSSPTTSRLWVWEHAADGSSTSVNVIRAIPTGIPRGLRDSMVCKVESTDHHSVKQQYGAGWWRHLPLVPVLWREGQLDICEVDTSLAYKVRSRTVRVLHKETVSKQNKTSNVE